MVTEQPQGDALLPPIPQAVAAGALANETFWRLRVAWMMGLEGPAGRTNVELQAQLAQLLGVVVDDETGRYKPAPTLRVLASGAHLVTADELAVIRGGPWWSHLDVAVAGFCFGMFWAGLARLLDPWAEITMLAVVNLVVNPILVVVLLRRAGQRRARQRAIFPAIRERRGKPPTGSR